jgi:hypothetical protein
MLLVTIALAQNEDINITHETVPLQIDDQESEGSGFYFIIILMIIGKFLIFL